MPLLLPLAAQSLPELFQKAKAQVKGESWPDAMQTLDRLEAESARPGNEAARSQLEAPMAFYRGVCEANLGQAEKAKADFETFLLLQPNASMDPSMYSKKAIAAFETAGRNVAPPDLDRRPVFDVSGLPGVQASAQLGRAGQRESGATVP